MDKTTFETFEFLPTNNVEASTDQFFVLQNDGTLLLNRQMQYVTQVQDVKEMSDEAHPCTTYDGSTQQFYVDVDSTNEFIVPDQLILPTESNNLYSNNYIQQPGTSTVDEQMEVSNIAQLDRQEPQETNSNPTHSNALTNGCTEIILTDGQYKMLQQKGWVLFELSDKVYVLNTTGLHDITANDKLIQKLRNEYQNYTTETDTGCLQDLETTDSTYPEINSSNQLNTAGIVKLSEDSVGVCEQQIDNLPLVNKEDSQSLSHENNVVESQCLAPPNVDHQMSGSVPDPIEVTTCTNEQNNITSVKIKTKFLFKDIPDNIFLGNTVNGKKLVAKIVKSQSKKRNIKRRTFDSYNSNNVYDKLDKSKCINNTALDEAQFLNLIQMAIKSHFLVKCNAKDVAAAERAIAHLLRIPNMKQSIVGHNLVITKVIDTQDAAGKIISRSKPTFVSGIIAPAVEPDGRFIHIPDLIQRLKIESDAQYNVDNATDCPDAGPVKAISMFHINIWESKRVNNSTRVSVTLNKRQLALDLITDLKKVHPNTVFACGTCAAIFKSEDLLREHQENQCFENDDVLASDTNKITNNVYTIIKHGKKNMYTCLQCKAKFSKLINCQNHVKIHSISDSTNTNVSENIATKPESKLKNEVYKCKMCSSTYFHPSTLSKHIVAKHINGK